MDKSEIKFCVGQIWEVESESFFAKTEIKKGDQKRALYFHIPKGEKIEIRYPFQWNYRTECNYYVNSTEKYILDNCKLFATVKEEIKSTNLANLEEILRLRLFDKI